jgi:predicted nucleic acid-binding Zn ribbon protein
MEQVPQEVLLTQLLEAVRQCAVCSKQVAESIASMERIYAAELAKWDKQRQDYDEDRKLEKEQQRRIDPMKLMILLLALAANLIGIALLVR